MKAALGFIMFIGIAGFVISLIALFVSIARKKRKRGALSAMALCFIAFLVAVTIYPNNEEAVASDNTPSLKERAVQANYNEISKDYQQSIDLAVYVDGIVSNIRTQDTYLGESSDVQAFILTQTTDNASYDYDIVNFPGLLSIELHDGDKVKVWGEVVRKENSADNVRIWAFYIDMTEPFTPTTEPPAATAPPTTEYTPQNTVTITSYQSILDEYTKKLQEATPKLIEEYNKEAASNNDGLTGLATISNSKVEKLAEILNNGISRMADYYLNSGSGKYGDYEDWAAKLYKVYEEEGAKIYDAYINSAMG